MDFERVVPTDELAAKPMDAKVPYVLTKELATAVNLALSLSQPLLLTGEPGCGKSTLAREVARQLEWDREEFQTKSTSTGKDVLYSYDAVARFHDAQFHRERFDAAQAAGVDSPYVVYAALGKAIRSPKSHVVLIDEIDKASRDFPNDLLRVVENKEFEVSELRLEPQRTDVQHFVLITSNEERDLPEAFLRRCVYAHIDFPGDAQLLKILEWHQKDSHEDAGLLRLAVEQFLAVRKSGLQKAPSTAELISWVAALRHMGANEDTLERSRASELPALGTLLKTQEDLRTAKDVRLK
jgi:MoxR-like ATPase